MKEQWARHTTITNYSAELQIKKSNRTTLRPLRTEDMYVFLRSPRPVAERKILPGAR